MINFLQKNKITFMIITLFIIIYGSISIFNIPKEAQPSINIPFYNISITYPGADPETIEEQVINKLEQKFKSISMVKKITSSSLYNYGYIVIEFYKGKKDVDATNDIKGAIDQIYPTLPSDAKYPVMKKVDINDSPIYTFSIAGPYKTEIIYEKIKTLEENIKSIPGISELTIIGKPVQQIKVNFDMQKIAELDLDFGYIISLLKSAFVKFPTDKKDINGKLYSFELTNYEKNLTGIVSQLKDYDIINKDGKSIKVKDLAEVTLSYKKNDKKSFVITNISSGTSINALSFQITKLPGFSVETLVQSIKTEVDNFSKSNAEFQYVETLSQEESINKMFNLFIENFFETGLLVFIIILIFLGRQSSIVIVISFLIVYLGNFAYLKAIGYSFNNIVSFSLILVLGVMIDNLIVISQGIVVGLQRNDNNIWLAIKDSIKNYSRAIIFGTSTTIAVFVPLYFGLSGVMGEYMRPMPVTIISNLVISLFITIIILPIIASYFSGKFLGNKHINNIKENIKSKLKIHAEKSNLGNSLLNIYRKLRTIFIFLFGEEKKSLQRLEKLGHKFANIYYNTNKTKKGSRKVIIGFIAFFIASFFLFPLGFLKFEFLGNIDSNNLWVNLKYSPGISIEENQKYTNLITNDIISYFNTNYPNILIYASIDLGKKFSSEGGGAGGTNQSSITLRLVKSEERDVKSYEIVENIQKYIDTELIAKHTYALEISPFTQQAGGDSGKPISFNIIGDDYIQVNNYIQKILPEIKKIEGIYNVSTSIEYTNGKIKYYVDENKAKQLGVNTMSIVTILAGLQNSEYEPNGIKIKDFNEFGIESIPINAYIKTNGNIDNIKLGKIYLSQIIGKKQIEPEINSIVRLNGKKNIKIEADKQSKVALSDITAKINEVINTNKLPDNLKYESGGDIQEQSESMADTGIAMIVGLILMFMVLIIQFNNIKYSIIIIGSVFLSIGGAIVILALFRYNMTFPAMLGLFGVLGVGVNQALIHIEDFKIFYEEDGLSVIDSFKKSIAERFIPIFLTKVTTITGLFILAFKDELFGSLAIAFIGGLIISFFITLFYIPSLMNLVSDEYYIK